MNTISQSTPATFATVVTPSSTSTPDSGYQATEAQVEIWLSSQQSNEANCAYNEISSLVFNGCLNVEHLRTAIRCVIDRNAGLRSTFSEDGQNVNVHRKSAFAISTCDFSTLTGDALNQSLNDVIEQEGNTAFDLINGPLIRFVLQKISETRHKLTVTAHHIAMDGWSFGVFCRDLGHFYDAANGKQPAALPDADQYHDYANAMSEYRSSEQRIADESFWTKVFEDAIPVLDLPTQNPRPRLRTYPAKRLEHVFPSELVSRFRNVAAKNGCSLFNGMLAAFNAYVSRMSGQVDFNIGIPTAGQSAMQHPELIGHCVNTMPLRNHIATDESFIEHMARSRSNLLTALDHQRLSFGALLGMLAPPRDPSRPPLVCVSFNLDPVIDVNQVGFEGLEVSVQVEPRCFENFEWFINGVIQSDMSLEWQVQYNANLFDETAMEGYLEGFEAFVSAVVDDPSQPIASYPVASIKQRQTMIVQWNDTEMEYPVDATLDQEFSRQAAQTPDRVAVEFQGKSLTYAEVESRSNQIARFLQEQGVRPGDLVGICVERSEQMLVNLYAILKAGAGYVPLDPAYPTDRLQYMCDHSGLTLVLTESSLKGRVAEFGKHPIEIDEHEEALTEFGTTPLATLATASDICYVIYTSGSTGKPKGVQVPHGSVVNFLRSMQREPGFTESDTLLAVTTLSFDISVLELYLPTITGGRVVVLDSASSADGHQLVREIAEQDISLLQATPATWRLLIESGWNGQSGLKALCGGEPMPADLVGPLLSRCGELWNMYGPTETTVWSSIYQITDENAPILIGKPIGNTQLYVLDQNQQELPAGCEGELYIGGAGVTLGYRNQPDLTKERFVRNRYRNPFANYVSDRLYKTGDVARYRHDGNVEFLRRNDKQVKIRGYRIELGEIEQHLKSHRVVQQCVVVVREDTLGDQRLVAYFVAKPDAVVSRSDLRTHMQQFVPPYMVPQNFVVLEQMPQTDNGKIDYKRLPKPNADVSKSSHADCEGTTPISPAEVYMAGVWTEVLETDDLFAEDTFFDIGGHSLLVMQVIATVFEKTGIRLSPQDFLVNTLAQLAHKIQDADVFQLSAVNGNPTQTPVKIDSEIEPASRVMADSAEGFWD